jgi:lysozyme
MKISQKGLNLIKHFEGLKLNAYQCSAKVWTIGYGSTFFLDGSAVKQFDKLPSESAAEKLLQLTVHKFESGVLKLIGSAKISQNQFDALVCFAFNVGLRNLNVSTLLKRVKENPNNPAIRAEFLRWNKAGGKILNGLTRRRIAEADLYFS